MIFIAQLLNADIYKNVQYMHVVSDNVVTKSKTAIRIKNQIRKMWGTMLKQ